MSQTTVWHVQTAEPKLEAESLVGRGSQGNGTRVTVVVEEVRGGQTEDLKVVSRGSSMDETLWMRKRK